MFWAAVSAYFGYVFAQIALVVGGLFIFWALFFLYVYFSEVWNRYSPWRCRHEEYTETMACHARCRKCGRDLGFIGDVRKQTGENHAL